MKVSIFITCIVDQMFPQVGAAMVKVLRRLGVEVLFNPDQTCCGQPAFNSGYRTEARQVARHMIDVFERELERADYIVAPSGSCTTMVRKFYSDLFEPDPGMASRIERISERVLEFSEFLTNVLKVDSVGAQAGGRVTYHDSCHLLRELGVSAGPRTLIKAVDGVELVEMDKAAACCGFGGTFSVKYPEISTAIDNEKLDSIKRTGVDTVVGCDSSCLMQMAGLAQRQGRSLRFIHLAELLASKAIPDKNRS
ncbi:MAG TPA: (Fe-S)-binding protein [Blastocatellia bacterium]|nr:(Fe-S)-binding protein [Blastocatellia bacterium]